MLIQKDYSLKLPSVFREVLNINKHISVLNNKFWETGVDVLSFKHSNLHEASNTYK
jgi:hypothetical protein